MLPAVTGLLGRPVSFHAESFLATPMDGGLRLAGTVELAPEDSEEMYLAVSELYDEVAYEFTLLDHDTLRWGDFEFYQKMA